MLHLRTTWSKAGAAFAFSILAALLLFAACGQSGTNANSASTPAPTPKTAPTAIIQLSQASSSVLCDTDAAGNAVNCKTTDAAKKTVVLPSMSMTMPKNGYMDHDASYDPVSNVTAGNNRVFLYKTQNYGFVIRIIGTDDKSKLVFYKTPFTYGGYNISVENATLTVTKQ